MNVNILHLGQNQPGRRQGLTRHSGPSLLRSINDRPKENIQKMAPNIAAQQVHDKKKHIKEVKEEEDINRPPDSDDSSSDEGNNRADIKSTWPSKPEEQKSKNTTSTAGNKGTAAVNWRSATRSTRSTRSSKENESPSSSNSTTSSTSSQKRKSPGRSNPFGSFGSSASGNKRAKKTYSRSNPTSSARTASSQIKASQSSDDEDRPKFKPPELPAEIESPERASAPVFKKPDLALDDSPSTPKKTKSSEVLKIVSPLSPSPLKTKITFNPPDPEIDDSFKGLGTNPDSSLPFMPSRAQSTPTVYAAPQTQPAAEFKAYSLDDDLASTAQALINDNRAPLLPIPAVFNDDDDFATMTQMARCPMCNKPVDPADIRAFGEMNTRMQEKFCRSHQKKTAEEEWDLKGYPTIDWERLDSRISKHHLYIKKLINGAESHYRTAFTGTINAGKDRSLLKMTSNLTPGYYGSRGLRAMSENVMRKFTPLLKTRTVKDRLISARGPIPFVQSVLVPEITVILIMEDMDVEIGEAREILSESCTIGDLVNEEIRDVFKRRVDDSEDESESDG